MIVYDIYSEYIPNYVQDIIQTSLFQRLNDVGMNCGMEYTQFESFRNCKGVSRYNHSFGVALITYHFTYDKHQTIAALLHDIGKGEYGLNIVEKSVLVILNKVSKGKLKKYNTIKAVDSYYNHAEKGANLLKQFNVYDKEFLDTVRYHHNNNVVGNKLLEIIRESDNRN